MGGFQCVVIITELIPEPIPSKAILLVRLDALRFQPERQGRWQSYRTGITKPAKGREVS